uniref:Uncharacterized protein n=1 Tax=Cacopsylla melanoneura TaxID=428564 RepID=A0A8D8U8H5_9HEMI
MNIFSLLLYYLFFFFFILLNGLNGDLASFGLYCTRVDVSVDRVYSMLYTNSLGLMLSALCMLLCISYEESIGSFLVATYSWVGNIFIRSFFILPLALVHETFVKKPMTLNVLTQETLQ